MPGVARIGDSTSTGHGCDGITTVVGPTGAGAKVFANKKPVDCVGDPSEIHRYGGRRCSAQHQAAINAGSPNVFVGGKALARIGDSTDGGAIISGSGDVIAN